MFAKYMARQLSTPTGLMGRRVLAPLWNKRNAALNDLVLQQLDLQPNDHVLDVGFGGGYLLQRMAGIITEGHLAGVDVSDAMVAAGKRQYRGLTQAGRLELHCAPAEKLPFEDARFSKVCTVNSLFYWDDVPQGLAELYRVLQVGGNLVVCITRKQSIEHKSFAEHGLKLFEEAQVCDMLEQAGFIDVAVTHAADQHREFVCIVGVKA